MNRLTSQPSSRNWTASQSSSSGWLGGSPCAPKSSAVLTIPVPKTWSQNRLTATRAVRGWLGATSHCASPSRLTGAPGGSGGKNAGTARPDLLAPLVVLAPLEQERRLGLARLLAKDQGRRNLFVELLCVLARPSPAWLRSGSKTASRLRIGVLDEVGAQLLGLSFGSLGPIDHDDRLDVRRAARRRRSAAGRGPRPASESKSCPSCAIWVSMPASIPVDRAAMLSERPAVDDVPGASLSLATGTSSRTHCLVAGRSPIRSRSGVPSLPQSITFSPQ